MIPRKIWEYIHENNKAEFTNFMSKYWEGDAGMIAMVWPRIHKNRERFKPINVNDVNVNLDFKKKLKLELEEEFPNEYDVLYDIIIASGTQHSFIIAFGHSWPPWAKKLAMKSKGTIRTIAARFKNKFNQLHKWKNEHIRPHTQGNETFHDAVGFLGSVSFHAAEIIVPQQVEEYIGTIIVFALEE